MGSLHRQRCLCPGRVTPWGQQQQPPQGDVRAGGEQEETAGTAPTLARLGSQGGRAHRALGVAQSRSSHQEEWGAWEEFVSWKKEAQPWGTERDQLRDWGWEGSRERAWAEEPGTQQGAGVA